MNPRNSRWLTWAVALGLVFGLTQGKAQEASVPASSGPPTSASPSAGANQPAQGTNVDFQPQEAFPNIFAPYNRPDVPTPSAGNSQRLNSLIQNGKVELALIDAIDLALENNLDIAVARYQLPLAQADYLRTQGGGAARGVQGELLSSAIFAGAIGTATAGSAAASTGGAGGFSGGGGAT